MVKRRPQRSSKLQMLRNKVFLKIEVYITAVGLGKKLGAEFFCTYVTSEFGEVILIIVFLEEGTCTFGWYPKEVNSEIIYHLIINRNVICELKVESARTVTYIEVTRIYPSVPNGQGPMKIKSKPL